MTHTPAAQSHRIMCHCTKVVAYSKHLFLVSKSNAWLRLYKWMGIMQGVFWQCIQHTYRRRVWWLCRVLFLKHSSLPPSFLHRRISVRWVTCWYQGDEKIEAMPFSGMPPAATTSHIICYYSYPGVSVNASVVAQCSSWHHMQCHCDSFETVTFKDWQGVGQYKKIQSFCIGEKLKCLLHHVTDNAQELNL